MTDTSNPTPVDTRPLHPQLVAPTLAYLTGEDVIRVVSWNSLAAVKLTILLRVLMANGEIKSYPFFHTPNTDRSAASTDANPFEGFLLGASVFASSGAPQRGQTFVALRLVRGVGAGAQESVTIAADYVTSQQRLSYPHSGVRSSLDGRGFTRSLTGTDPAVNTECSDAVPTGARWRLVSWRTDMVTDATVSNRVAQFVVDDGTTEVFRQPSALAHTASNTFRYQAGPGLDRRDGGGVNGPQFSTPIDMWTPAGYRFKTVTTNLQAGDNWGAPQILVEELLEAA